MRRACIPLVIGLNIALQAHGAIAQESKPLSTHMPVVVQVDDKPMPRSHELFFREQHIPSDTARLVFFEHMARFPTKVGRKTVYRVPGHPDLFLVAAFVESKPEPGNRFAVYRWEDRTIRFVALSGAPKSKDGMEPSFFHNETNVLVLGEMRMGDGVWGLAAYDLGNDLLEDLGLPRVAAPNFGSPLGDGASPLPYLTAEVSSEGYRLVIESDLLLNPGTQRRIELCREPGQPIVLRQTETAWAIENAVRVPSPVLTTDVTSC